MAAFVSVFTGLSKCVYGGGFGGNVQCLDEARLKNVGMGNAIRYLKDQIGRISGNVSLEEVPFFVDCESSSLSGCPEESITGHGLS